MSSNDDFVSRFRGEEGSQLGLEVLVEFRTAFVETAMNARTGDSWVVIVELEELQICRGGGIRRGRRGVLFLFVFVWVWVWVKTMDLLATQLAMEAEPWKTTRISLVESS